MDATWWIQFSDVSFSCFKVKCYLEGCIEVMVFGEKFLLNVGAAKTAGKVVAKGLYSPNSQVVASRLRLAANSDKLSCSVCLQLWNRYRSAITSFFGAKWGFSMSSVPLCVRLSGRRSTGEQRSDSVSYALAPFTEIRMASLLCLPLSSARIVFL